MAVACVGLAGGLASGLLGIGGAVVMVPLMVTLLGLSQHRAHGTSLAVVIFTAAAALIGYGLNGHVDVVNALPLIAGSVLGAPLGARWADKTSPAGLRRGFGLVMLLVGARMVFPRLPSAAWIPSVGAAALAARAGLGFVVGVLSGFTGVGGGTVLVPALVLLAGVPQHDAQGLSLVFVIPTAIAGAWTHHRLGNVDTKLVLPLGLWSALGAFAASFVAASLSGGTLRALFGVFLVVIGLRMALSGGKPKTAAARSDAPAA